MSTNELGAFLRSRRESLSPDTVGLPVGSRRRTPGLRRGELATLAGVSVEYLARLEQGRDRHPSAQVIDALAEALRLSTDERLQLRSIIKAADGVSCLVVEPPSTEAGKSVRMLLDRLEPTPAVVVNRLTDVLAQTAAFRLLMEPLGLFDRPKPNLARFVLTDPRARQAYPEWSGVADAVVAGLRPADPHVAALMAELGVRLAGRRGPAVEELRHPEAGQLRLRRERLTVADAGDLQIVVYLPDDEETASRLDRLIGAGPHPIVEISANGSGATSARTATATRNRVAARRATRP